MIIIVFLTREPHARTALVVRWRVAGSDVQRRCRLYMRIYREQVTIRHEVDAKLTKDQDPRVRIFTLVSPRSYALPWCMAGV